ncbi:NAD(P)/FAD-dependent oxidoreductase [Halopseudomonas xiamenensis]|uniref:NAD(P)/FAD-dependent oxidoreductase n=1 Tax=Halopseudomonas xiamenensis TaxID=157792 RepID=UPI001629316C|nr:NAD(P)/FAD-dependent oxidoreductase [Halopseudomonas xiamenensis]
MDEVECVVVGAGVVGLAVARALALSGREVLILEGEDCFGSWTSARNSEVIHAGIYYPQGSLKAHTCVRGRDLLYDYCQTHGIAHHRCGKLIVATDDTQLPALQQIAEAARRNGVDDLHQLSAAQAVELEPRLSCVGALLSPSTGIIDSHAYMLSLLGEAEAHGAVLACRSRVTGLRWSAEGCEVCINDEAQPLLRTRLLINSAGLAAPALAALLEVLPAEHVPRSYYAKGSYYTLAGRAPFSRLIYPVPEPGGLGVHLTLDLAGQARFGPDVEWVEKPDYRVDQARAEGFNEAIRRYWPELRSDALSPGYAGVRPKISGPDQPAADFLLSGPAQHGCAGVINLFGIESPGLTSSLAIAELVVEMADQAEQGERG